jgi:hypothetical protein
MQNNCYFCSTYVFSSVGTDAEIDEICRSENDDGTKHASCLNSCFSVILYMIRASFEQLFFIGDQLSLLFYLRLLFCWDRRWDWWNLQIGRRWWNQACILFKLLLFCDTLHDQNFLWTTDQLPLLFYVHLLFCWDQRWDWWGLKIGKRWWNQIYILFKLLIFYDTQEINYHFCSTYSFSSVEIHAEIDVVRRSEDIDGTKYTSCLSSWSSVILYMIRTFFGLQINCHFCSTYAFSSVEIHAEIDEVRRSENVDGTEHASCLNSCSSVTLCMIRTSFEIQINRYFCSTYVFSSVEIDAEIDEVCRSEDVNGTKHASYLDFCSSVMFCMIRDSFE